MSKKIGRPKSAPTKVITFRILDEPVYEAAIRNAVKKEKKRLDTERLKGNA